MGVARVVLAAACGWVLYLSFAPRPWWWLAPIAFAGLALALRGRRVRAGFGLGFVFGLAFFVPLLGWLHGFLVEQFGPWPWLGLSAVMALYLALAGALITLVARLPGAPVWMALVIIALEIPRGRFPLGGFSWGRVAFSQPEGVFTSLAGLGGPDLVGVAVVLCGFGLAQLILAGRDAGWRPRRALARHTVWVVLPVAAGLMAWPFVDTTAQAGSLTVAAVQGNAPDVGLALQGQRGVLRTNHLAESRRLLADIRAGRAPTPDLLVWPETATAIRGRDAELDALVRAYDTPALIGARDVLPDGRSRNSVIAWDPATGRGARYDKQQLVPFGEYLPAPALARWVTPFIDDADTVTPGTGRPAALEIAGTTVGVFICYEAAYDYPAREAVRAGAQLLVAPTNNAWYGRSEMSYQQLAMARLRAVEHSRAVVVAATSGVSAIVRPDGSLARSTGLFTAESLVEPVPLRHEITPAVRLGAFTDYALLALALAAIAAATALRARRGRGRRRTPDRGNTVPDAEATRSLPRRR